MNRGIDRRRMLIGAAAVLAALVAPQPRASSERITVLYANGRRYVYLKPSAHAECAAIVRAPSMRAQCARHGIEFARYA